MKKTTFLLLAFACSGLVFTNIGLADASKDFEYEHDKFGTCLQEESCIGIGDYVKNGQACKIVFDGQDDDTGDGNPDYLRVAHFVAYEIKPVKEALPKQPKRPKWRTNRELYDQGVAPGDSSYRYSKAFRKNHPDWYVRGHLCMANHAWRVGKNKIEREKSFKETFSLLNAVPQRANFNSGIWLDLEKKTGRWADQNKQSVWIVTGPIFYRKNTPSAWIGEKHKGEYLVAIPDALFKVIIRETNSNSCGLEALAFIYDQDVATKEKGSYNHEKYLVSIDEIEKRTGLDLLTRAGFTCEQPSIEKEKASQLWG